jgi:putative PEP-CTERM system TPR-repeat lipoprotein
MLLARAHVSAKQPEEALKVLRAALELRPDLATVQRDLVALYLVLNRPEEALRQARAAQAQTPEQPHGYVLEGEVHFVQRKFDLAERKYREALKKSDLPHIAIRVHASMEATGKRMDADTLARDWIKRHPEDATVLAYLGERDLTARRYESAATRYEAALKRAPDNALYLNNLAWVTNELKRPQALEYAERAHALAPEVPAVMDTLGVILARSGQLERGLALLERATELAPDSYSIRLNFGKALIQAGRKNAARKELQPLLKLDAHLPVRQEAAKLLGGL